jgi:hypothetical protein
MNDSYPCAVCNEKHSRGAMWQHWLDRHEDVLKGWLNEHLAADPTCTEHHVVSH